MAIEYTLRINDSNIDINFLKRVFNSLNIVILGERNIKYGFEFYKFRPDIKQNITFIREPDKAKNHPYNYYETIFLNNEFYCNEYLSYRFEKNLNDQDANLQYKAMLTSVFKVAMYTNKDMLFTGSSGEEKFIFINQEFIFEASYFDYLYKTHGNIFRDYTCKKFDGIAL